MKKNFLVFSIFSFIWGGFFLYSIITALGTTPISLNKNAQTIIASALPQGWGFFSKNPRDTQFMVYANTLDDKQTKEILWPNMKVENVFGISREGRSQGVEFGSLTSNLEEKDWNDCVKGDLKSCTQSDLKEKKIKNNTPTPLICGKYYITQETAIPWNYAKYTNTQSKITKISKVDIICN